MAKDNTKILGNVVKIVNDTPASAAVLSKLNKPEVKDPDLNPMNVNLPQIAASTWEKLKNNDDIMKLFPDVELSIQIMVSSIISPNDLLTTKLSYDVENIRLPLDIKNTLLEIIEEHIEKHYKLTKKLPDIIREALYTKGAYIEAIIPEASLDDIINNRSVDGTISFENYGFLGSYDTNKVNLSLEKYIPKDKKVKQEVIAVTQEDLNIEILDNPNVLLLRDALVKNTTFRTKNMIKRNSKRYGFGLTKEATDDFDKIFRSDRDYDEKETIVVTNIKDASRQSISRPLTIKVPSEALIPIHVMKEPSKHLGYFLLLDELGNPLVTDNGMFIQDGLSGVISSTTNNNLDSNLNLIQKARQALLGITGDIPVINKLEEIYSNIVEELLRNKLKTGLIGDLGEFEENTELYRVMLYRALKGQKTKILFIPQELVVYYAFDYRDNGTGRSLLEKSSVLYSIKAIILFARLMAYVKNSITTTLISADIDERHPRPELVMEQIISEAMKSKQANLPLGIINLNDLVDWSNKVGLRFNIKHPKLARIDIEKTTEQHSVTVPDQELNELLDELIFMSQGLTPEIARSGFESDFATTISSKNLLFAKRVEEKQEVVMEKVTEHVSKLLTNDMELRAKLVECIDRNKKEILKFVKAKKKQNKDKTLKLPKLTKQAVSEYIIETLTDNIVVSLPKPEVQNAAALKEAFENFISDLETVTDKIVSSTALDSEIVGDLSGKADNIKAIFQTSAILKWLSDNKYMPEITEFLSKDDEGKPVFDLLSNFKLYYDQLGEAILPFLKDMDKSKKKVDKKLEKYGGGDSFGGGDFGGGDDDEGGDDFGGDGDEDEEGGDEDWDEEGGDDDMGDGEGEGDEGNEDDDMGDEDLDEGDEGEEGDE